jgi:hypothetical protein
MENIGRLVNALEDQHRQRRFNIARPSGNASKNTSIDLGNSFQVTDPPVSNKGANANGSPGTSLASWIDLGIDCTPGFQSSK